MENENLKLIPGCVSIIIPCYNYAHFLPETLDSIRLQTYSNWECIIVDDGSTDNTKEIAQYYILQDSRFKYLHQNNGGAASARNAGIEESKGEFIQFLDADDLIELDKLKYQADFLVENPDVDIVYGSARFFTKKNHQIELFTEAVQKFNNSGKGESIVVDFLQGNLPVISTPLSRRAVLQSLGMLREELEGNEDYEFWLRCAIADKNFFYLKEKNTNALIRKGHHSLSADIYKMFIGSILAHKILERNANNLYTNLLKSKREEFVKFYGDQLYKAAVYVDTKKYTRELLQALISIRHLYLAKLLVDVGIAKFQQVLSKLKGQIIRIAQA